MKDQWSHRLAASHHLPSEHGQCVLDAGEGSLDDKIASKGHWCSSLGAWVEATCVLPYADVPRDRLLLVAIGRSLAC
jgi:hypothetical protein